MGLSLSKDFWTSNGPLPGIRFASACAAEDGIDSRARHLPAQNPAIAAARKHFPCGQVPVWDRVLPPEDDRAPGACFFSAIHFRRGIVRTIRGLHWSGARM